MFLTKGNNIIVIVWLIVLIGSTETLFVPSHWVLATALSHAAVHLLDKRRESIVLDLVHLLCFRVIDARTARFVYSIGFRLCIFSLGFRIRIEWSTKLLSIISLVDLVVLLAQISKYCRSKLLLVLSVSILVVHAKLLQKVIVFLLNHGWRETCVVLLHVLVFKLDGLTTLRLSFWAILEHSIRERVLLLALRLSLSHLNEQLSLEAGFCARWWRNLICLWALLTIIILAYLQCLCLFSVRKHCIRGSRLFDELISSTFSTWALDRIDFSLCNRICTNTNITCLVHFHREILLLIWLIP